MRSVGTFEAKNKLSELLDAVERGEEIEITRRGKPVARLVATSPAFDESRKQGALRRLRETRAFLKKEGVKFTTDEILALRDEGRK
jgi:prevent-host-death family protein